MTTASIDQEILDAYRGLVCPVLHTCVNISSHNTVRIFKTLNVFRIVMVLSTIDRYWLISKKDANALIDMAAMLLLFRSSFFATIET